MCAHACPCPRAYVCAHVCYMCRVAGHGMARRAGHVAGAGAGAEHVAGRNSTRGSAGVGHGVAWNGVGWDGMRCLPLADRVDLWVQHFDLRICLLFVTNVKAPACMHECVQRCVHAHAQAIHILPPLAIICDVCLELLLDCRTIHRRGCCRCCSCMCGAVQCRVMQCGTGHVCIRGRCGPRGRS